MTLASYKGGIITSREVTTAQTFLIKIAMHDKVKPKYICKTKFNMIKRGSVACLGQAVENLRLRELDPRTPRTRDLHDRKNQISKSTLGQRTAKEDQKNLSKTQPKPDKRVAPKREGRSKAREGGL